MEQQDQRDSVGEGRPLSDFPYEASSQRVRHLLNVARAEFFARGLDAVSIDSIARVGKISKETIYRHFPDKEALFRAALDVAGAEFLARAEAVHRAAIDSDVELAGLARAILDFTLDQGMFSAMRVAAGVARRMPDFANSLQQAQWRRLEPVRQALEDYARRHGRAKPVPFDMALDFGSLAVEGPAVLMGFPPAPSSVRDRVAEQVALLFSGGIGAVINAGIGDVPLSFTMVHEARAVVPDHIRTLLSVAAQHFLDEGYEGANLDQIGGEARVGRGTLYRHAGNKAGLFAAAMRQRAYDCVPSEVASIPSGRIDHAALTAFLEGAMAGLACDASLRLHRVAISQSHRDADTAQAVFTILRTPWVEPAAAWLASLGLRGDCEWYARQLLVLATRGNRLFVGEPPLPPEERSRHAERAATIFLEGFTSLL